MSNSFSFSAPASRLATGGLALRGAGLMSIAPSVPFGAAQPSAHGVTLPQLSIRTFGSLEVSLDGEAIELPASRRTRALLAFLALSKNQQRRDRLCDFFWDNPIDPRGSLRWSLSKLRPIINAGGSTRLLTDRERVQIIPESIAVDFHELRVCANDERASVADLSRAWEISSQPLVEDCELPDQPGFMAWLQHQRNENARLRIQLSRRLALMPGLSAEDAELWAQRWLHEVPGDARAVQQVAIARRRLGKEPEGPAAAANLHSASQGTGLASQHAAESQAGIEVPASALAAEDPGKAAPSQVIRFVQTDAGTALAWASTGASGHPPLVKAANWLAHMDFDWQAPVWNTMFRDLARTFRLISYDERGCGLSDWDVPKISFETSVSDLERVVDAAGLERFPLLGISHGAAISIEYAARHPERVSHLILVGGCAAGWRHTATPEERREREAIMVLTGMGWGRDNPCYRNIFSRPFIPDANSEELRWFDEFQRRTTSAKNAVRFLDAFSRMDVRDRLKDVRAPTLVLHSRGDTAVPVAAARELAGQIPDAEFVGLDSNNHLPLGRERAATQLLQNVRRFLAREVNAGPSGTAHSPGSNAADPSRM